MLCRQRLWWRSRAKSAEAEALTLRERVRELEAGMIGSLAYQTETEYKLAREDCSLHGFQGGNLSCILHEPVLIALLIRLKHVTPSLFDGRFESLMSVSSQHSKLSSNSASQCSWIMSLFRSCSVSSLMPWINLPSD